jgi:DNA-binding transcriptional MerR regulator
MTAPANVRDSFGSAEVCRLTGIGFNTLHYWDKTAFLCPSVQQASGTGTRKRYSLADVLALRVACLLRQAGASLKVARKAARNLHDAVWRLEDLQGTFLVTDGDWANICADRTKLVELRECEQASVMFVVDLGRVVEELQAAIEGGSSSPDKRQLR